jgi:hypothetical protein
MLDAVGRRHRREQRQRARAHHRAEVDVGRHHHKEIRKGRLAPFERLEPGAVLRDVVDDAVEHQAKAASQALDIAPVAPGRVDLFVVDHREAVVG